jgi:hypothetical protein
MNILEILTTGSGQDSLGKMAGELGLNTTDVGSLLNAVTPALSRGLQRQMQTTDGLESVKSAPGSGGHQRYLNDPSLMSSDDSRADGNNILGHIFGSKDISRNVAAQAATNTGIDASIIRKALPLIASLAMGAISKGSNAGQSLDNVGLGSQAADDEFGLDDVLDLARKFF